MTTKSSSKLIGRMFLFMAVIMLVPIIPFVFLGDAFEMNVEHFIQDQQASPWLLVLVMVALAVDILLPIPSSGVCTLAGGVAGIMPATIASFVGLSLGALFGYALTYRWGEWLARRLCSDEDWLTMKKLMHEYGVSILAISRPLPLLAEAAVLVAGTLRLPLRLFLWPVLVTNFLLALLYSCLGAWFSTAQSLPWAIAISLVVPIGLGIVARLWAPRMLSSRGAMDSVETATPTDQAMIK